MAETTKLSVGKVLDKLRSSDEAPKSKRALFDEKIEAIDEETQRMRAMRRRLEHASRPDSTPSPSRSQGAGINRAALIIVTGLAAVAVAIVLTGLAGIW
jgi:hypothetical protein